jgi:uncharacterized membrane protein YedE/YeeE
VIDQVLESIELLLMLLQIVGAVLVGSYLIGRKLRVRLGMAIFVLGTAILAFLAYREYQYHVDSCKDSPEVAAGGDKLSCLEPYNWFAIHLGVFALLLAELGLATLLAAGLFRRLKRRRHPGHGQFHAEPS